MNIFQKLCDPRNASVEQIGSLSTHNEQSIQGLDLLTAELNSLSIKERNKVYEEIHGVSDAITETPELINDSIAKMKAHIQKLPKIDKRDLDKARYLRPSLDDDQTFFLMFLRARRFDAEAAAECLCAYFRHKRELFGEENLLEKITFDHLASEEKKLVMSGCHQLLQGRENTGRSVLLNVISHWDKHDHIAHIRMAWYTIITVLEENEDIQKRGIVGIGTWHGSYSKAAILDVLWKGEKFHKYWPVHFNSVHYCFDDPALKLIFKGLHGIFPKEMRLRQRYHFGSVLETQHTLMSFGINAIGCFEAGIGVQSKIFIENFLQSRRQIEAKWKQNRKEMEERQQIIWYPNPNDCLMGRAYFRHVKDWPGNVLLFKMIQASIPRYAQIDPSDKFGKTIITVDLIQVIREKYGTRFLERTEDGWEESKEHLVRAKVAQALRNGVKYQGDG